ncbi:MAG: hypothetical protein IJY44_05665 [Bacteroidaceae bacterium]|nr:hypothetical protein [Bacteroidaceae bacterium]
MNRPYIINDENGNPINGKYPPDKELYGEEFGGYKNEAEKILFHDFAVSFKDIAFVYNNARYYFYRHKDLVKVYHAYIKKSIEEYRNELELLENFSICGIPFIDLLGEICDLETFVDVFTPHLAIDKNGFPYNGKYPPNKEKHGDLYEGYKNKAEGVIFYDFGVQNYDVSFKYKGKDYYLLTEVDHVAVCDNHFTEEYETYANAMELVENFKIDGKPLIELLDKIEEIDPE